MPDTEIKSICNANMSTNRFNYMNAAKEIVRKDRDGVFDYASAARDLEWDDDIQVDAFRTLEILADTVRALDVFELVDDANKSAATWAWRFEAHKAAYEDLEEMLFLRPESVIQLVKKRYAL